MKSIQIPIKPLLLAGLMAGLTLSSFAVELTGKPVPVGSVAQSVAPAASNAISSSAAQSQNGSTTSNNVENSSSTAVTPPEPIEPPEPPEPEDQSNFQGGWQGPWEHHDGESLFGNVDALIPLVAIAFVFGGPVFLIIALARMHYADRLRKQININNNIDKLLSNGRDIPAELILESDSRDYASLSYMSRGMRNVGLGLGLFLFLTILCGIKIGAIGFLFLGYGMSQLVVWYLARREQGVGPG